MKFHHQGYVSADPRIQPPADVGIDRAKDIPDQVDILIIGPGPAGMITATQLSQFPTIATRIVDRRAGRLEIGQADGIQKRSVETFEAFGFTERITAEARQITGTAFWRPNPEDHACHHARLAIGRGSERCERIPPRYGQPGPCAGLFRGSDGKCTHTHKA